MAAVTQQHARHTGRSHRWRLSHRQGFWVVAYAFTVTMAFSAAPTPLYGLYQQRDHLAMWVTTVVFAAYAGGVVLSLFVAGHVSDWVGRRRVLVPAVLGSAIAALLFEMWPSLAGLLVARVLSGIAVGGITATATSALGELHLRSGATRSPRRPELVATAANLGGIGLGPLVAGVLADASSNPLQLPYEVFLVLLLVAAVGLWLVPETADVPDRMPRYRMQRIAVPSNSRGLYFAAAATSFAALAVFGLFTSVAPTLIAEMTDNPTHTLTGAVAFIALAAGAVVQILMSRRSTGLLLSTGLIAVVVGMAVLCGAVAWNSAVVFVIGGVIAGAGAGLLFKSSLSVVAGVVTKGRTAEALAGLFLAGYLGLAVPIVGLGVASGPVGTTLSLLGFSIVIVVIALIGGLAMRTRSIQPSSATA